MIVEWVFLISVLSGPFDPDTEQGWRDRERARFRTPDLATCENIRYHMTEHYRAHPVLGGAVIITGCQPEHTQ